MNKYPFVIFLIKDIRLQDGILFSYFVEFIPLQLETLFFNFGNILNTFILEFLQLGVLPKWHDIDISRKVSDHLAPNRIIIQRIYIQQVYYQDSILERLILIVKPLLINLLQFFLMQCFMSSQEKFSWNQHQISISLNFLINSESWILEAVIQREKRWYQTLMYDHSFLFKIRNISFEPQIICCPFVELHFVNFIKLNVKQQNVINTQFKNKFEINISMASFKSPQVQICGKITKVFDPNTDQGSSFYVKANFIEGQQWKLISGKKKFQTFESEAQSDTSFVEHPFSLHYITTNMRGWPRLLVQAWRIDEDGRHNIYGYGTVAIPFGSGEYSLQIPCWRPVGTWYDRFIGANSQLQYPGVTASSLNRYGLRTFSGCTINVEVNVIGRNFQLHGVIR